MAKALWHINPEFSELRDVDAPIDKTGLIRVESKYSLISTGTERLVSSGLGMASLEAFMSVPYMEGGFSLPIKYGYSLVGVVTSEGTLKGKHVHLMHPHQSECWVDASSVTVLPDDIPLSKAPLISNLETIINAIWDSEVSIGERVMICGFGNIGVLLAETLRHYPGIEICIMEKQAYRKQLAKDAGFQVVEDIPSGLDVTFETTSSAQGLQNCIQALKHEGKVINLSWYGSKTITLDLGTDFHYGRKQIISSQVSQIPHSKKDQWSYAKRKALAMKLLMEYPYENYISSFIPFGDSPAFYDSLRKGEQGDGLIWCIAY